MDESERKIHLHADAGRRPSLDAAYARYNRRLVRYFSVQAPGYGEDLAQETWLAISLSSFDFEDREFRLQLFTEARHQMSEFRRTIQREAARPVAPRSLDSLNRNAVEDAPASDDALRAMLGQLKPLQAEIVLLRVVAGFTAEETGAMLGKSPVQVRVTQHRILRQLARRLGN